MNKTERYSTPGGSPDSLENPPSSEVGSTDSGESQLLHLINPFSRKPRVNRSPPTRSNVSGKKSPPITPASVKIDSAKSKSLAENNNELRTKLEIMEKLYQELKKEVDLLREENMMLKTSHLQNRKASPPPPNISQYETDEEELARETEGIHRRPTKKRKAGSSPEVIQSKVKTRQPQGKKPPVKISPPPPINIVGQSDYSKLLPILKETLQTNFKVTSLHNNTWKINVNDSDGYRTLSKKLNTEKIEWYTFSNKLDRPIRVVARGLHPSCTKEDVMNDLKEKGFKILDATNIIKKEKRNSQENRNEYVRRGLPLFMLSFDKAENIDTIYNIKTILNMVIKIEPLRKSSRLIPQCKRCQGFNHTQTFCRKEPRCVKCAGKHSSDECRIDKQSPATCVNCKENHPANYRGCEVAKEIQKRRDTLKKSVRPQQKPKKAKPETSQINLINKRASKSINDTKKPKETKDINERSKPSTTNTYAQVVSGFSKPIKGKMKPKETQHQNAKPKPSDTKTYAKVESQNQEQSTNIPDPVSQVFSLILARLEEQSRTNKLIFEKLSMLESKTHTSQNKL